MSKKSDRRTLQSCKKDLTDDGGALSTITRRVGTLSDTYGKLISDSRTSQVQNLIAGLKEPSQAQDYYLDHAADGIQDTIDDLTREIEAEEAAAREAARAALQSLLGGN